MLLCLMYDLEISLVFLNGGEVFVVLNAVSKWKRIGKILRIKS